MHASLPANARLAFGALAATLVLTGCGQSASEPAPPPAPAVTVAVPVQDTIVDWTEYVGRFEASQRVEVRARTSGFLERVRFEDGEAVEQGQLLFSLDHRPAAAAKASAEADAVLARSSMERAEKLIADQAISQAEYDAAASNLAVAEANLQARTLELEFTSVRAPISGTVSDRRVDAGNVISGGAASADVLTTIVATDPIYFEFEASEAELLDYQRKSAADSGEGRVEIRLQDEMGYPWKGSVDFADNVIDGASGSFRLRAIVDNPDGFLKPGMFGRARVQSSSAHSALLIPETAILSSGSNKLAYVVADDGVVNAVNVQTGSLVGDLRVVTAGLTETDRVIVSGIQRARPGAQVQAASTIIELANDDSVEPPTTLNE